MKVGSKVHIASRSIVVLIIGETIVEEMMIVVMILVL